MTIKRSAAKVKDAKPVKKTLSKTATKLVRGSKTDPKPVKSPDVIVDFEYDGGLIFIVIENAGGDSAYDTSVRFNKKILGMQKTKDISSLRIFQSLRFLPPGKKIRILVDLFQFYVAYRQPMQISTTVSFYNKQKQTFQNTIWHDLSIYSDFADICNVRTV